MHETEPKLPTADETRRFIAYTEAARDKRIDDLRKGYREKANKLIDEHRTEVAAILTPHRAYLKAADANEAAALKGEPDA